MTAPGMTRALRLRTTNEDLLKAAQARAVELEQAQPDATGDEAKEIRTELLEVRRRVRSLEKQIKAGKVYPR